MKTLQRKISSRRFAELLAEEQIEPRGQWRKDMRAVVVAATIANVNRDQKKHPSAYQPTDFIPEFGPREPMDEEAIKAKALAVFSIVGGVGFGDDCKSSGQAAS